MKVLSWAILLPLILLVSCTTTTTNKVEEESRSKLSQSIEDEVTIGREMAARLFGRFGNYENKAALEYLNFVGRSIASQVGRPELVYRFAILDTSEVNAYACPGGYIFVTRGILSKLGSEDELAAVLSHEIAHVNAKHMYQALQSKNKITWAEILARLFTHGYGDLGASLSMIVDRGLAILLDGGYGMDKEFEADKMGVSFAAATGYNPESLSLALQRIEGGRENTVLLKTHPPLAARINNISSFERENSLEAGLIPLKAKVLKKRFSKFKQSLSGSA